MEHQIKVGVVGCGYWGPNLIRNFRSLGDCRLSLMCDLNQQRLSHLRALYPDVGAETDYAHMLNGAVLDAVAIATAVHAAIVIMAGNLQNVVSTADRRLRVRRALALALVAIAVWFAFSTGRTH